MAFTTLFRWLVILTLTLAPAASRADDPAVVFAAASMKDALEAAARDYDAATGESVVFSFAASSILARQVEAGAPADAFISADQAWMDWLAERGLIDSESRRVVAGNSLVIATAAASPAAANPADLLAAGRFAMGDPSHVPAGIYAQAALESLGLWERVKDNAVFGENVRVALGLVRRGEAAAAIVYASDLRVAPELSQAFVFPQDSHPPILYPAARVKGGAAAVAGFLDFLSGESGQRILAAHGFAAAKP